MKVWIKAANTVATLAWLLAMTACGGGSGGSGGGATGGTSTSASISVQADSTAVASQPVGVAGGTVETTGADGARYSLVIPPGALAEQQTISVAPVASIANLPLSGGLLAGVQLKPDGTRFLKPVTLTIAVPPGTDLSRLVGYMADGDGSNFQLYPTQLANGSVTMTFTHFTEYGVGKATQADIDALLKARAEFAGNWEQQLEAASYAARQTGADPWPTINAQHRDFWARVVSPGLEIAKTSEAVALSAINDFLAWGQLLERIGVIDRAASAAQREAWDADQHWFNAQSDAGWAALKPIIDNAVAVLSSQCRTLAKAEEKQANADKIGLWYRRGVFLAGYDDSALALIAAQKPCLGLDKPVTVAEVGPAAAAKGVPVTTSIWARFLAAEALDPDTLNTYSMVPASGAAEVVGTVSTLLDTATLKPNQALAYNTTYTVSLHTTIADVVNNRLAEEYRWSFTTELAPPVVAPAAGATGVPTDAAITATFAQDMDAATIDSGTFLIVGVPGVVTYDPATRTARLKPTAPLVANRSYTALVRAAVRDAAGNQMARDFSWSLSTAASRPEFLSFTIRGSGGRPDVPAVIDNAAGTISVQLPGEYGTDLSALVAGFAIAGDSVTVNGVPQTSGETSNNFSGPVTYTLLAADGTARDFVVTVRSGAYAPYGISANGALGSVSLTWAVIPGVTSYNIYRATAAGEAGSLVGTSDRASFSDTTVTNGTTYYYRVSAQFGSFEGPRSAAVSALPDFWQPVKMNGRGLTTVYDVVWGGDRFVAVGYGGTVDSPDGVNWTRRSLPTGSGIDRLRGVAYGNGQFVAIGSSDFYSSSPYFHAVFTSPDGIAWTRSIVLPQGVEARDVAWGGGKFVVLAFGNDPDGKYFDQSAMTYASVDGISWERTFIPSNRARSVAWGGGKYVMVYGSTSVSSMSWTSPDAATWTWNRSPGGHPEYVHHIAWNGSQFVAVGQGYTNATWVMGIMSSADGVTWTTRPVPACGLDAPAGYCRGVVEGVAWNGTEFVAGAENYTLTSPDGITWTAIRSARSVSKIAWGAGRFVAAGAGGPYRSQ